MNIVFALTYFDELYFTGGTQSLVKSLSYEFAKRGINIVILNVNHMNEKGNDDICVKKYDWGESVSVTPESTIIGELYKKILRRFLNANFYIKKRKVLRYLNEADAIIFFDVNEMSFPVALKNIPVLKLFYCCTLIEKEALFKKRYFASKLLRESSDLYLASNVYTKEVLERLGVNNDIIKVLPYGIDTHKYSRIGEYSFDEKCVGFLGGIEHRKGIHILTEACNEIKTPHRLLIAGQIRDDKYCNSLKKEIEKLNKGQFCKAEFSGHIPDEKIIHFFSSLSVFVCPSLSEEFGIVVLEAMACNVPVIASSTGGLKTIIKNGKNGLLFENGNSDDLKNKINILLNDKDYACKLANNARKTVEEIYSIKKTAGEIKSYIENKIQR